jgi:hypothetical protein
MYTQDNDVHCCVADCGWITGHTYIVYGPLCLGATTVMFESVPTYPTPYRYWEVVQAYKVTQFYTAPTAIRTLMKFDPEPIANYDLSSLKVNRLICCMTYILLSNILILFYFLLIYSHILTYTHIHICTFTGIGHSRRAH